MPNQHRSRLPRGEGRWLTFVPALHNVDSRALAWTTHSGVCYTRRMRWKAFELVWAGSGVRSPSSRSRHQAEVPVDREPSPRTRSFRRGLRRSRRSPAQPRCHSRSLRRETSTPTASPSDTRVQHCSAAAEAGFARLCTQRSRETPPSRCPKSHAGAASAAKFRAKKFAEPVSLSSTPRVSFPLPRTAPALSFDLLAIGARRNRHLRVSGPIWQEPAEKQKSHFAKSS